jgi:hypothetical protein
MFQTGGITDKGHRDQIKDLRMDVMIKGRNESRDVVIKGPVITSHYRTIL